MNERKIGLPASALALWLTMLMFLPAACGSGRVQEEDRIATRVAEEQAVAATLTAAAGGNDAAVAPPTSTSIPATAAPAPTEPPPTPTPIVATVVPALTEAPSPTPTPIVAAVIPVDGSVGEGREILISEFGRAVLVPGIRITTDGSLVVFGDELTARVKVFDDRGSVKEDGFGIDTVTFEVVGAAGSYQKTEEQAPYCLFGGNDPACPGITLGADGANWPPGRYDATITIQGEEDWLQSQWFWQFCVQSCEG
ncbi:MAG: hypothetical protein H6642_17555 [Caldilineaceae bacterium]|nr:hypothetical protein [Caldilineaceae bacterium]